MITASHNPWTDNGFKVKSADGAAASPDILATVERVIRERASSQPPRRPFADAEAAGRSSASTRSTGYVELRRAHARPRSPPGRRHARPRRAAVGLGRRLDPAAAGRRQDPRRRDPRRAQPVVRRRQPGADPPEHRRGAAASSRGGGYDLGLAARRRRRPCRGGRRAGHVHPPARRSWACSCTTCSSTAACAQPVVSTINETSMVGRLGRALRRAMSTRRPSASSTSGPKMIETGAMMGGEESGGYGFGMHLPERDGIYADLLLLDLFIREREAGRWPVSQAVAPPARDRRPVVLPARRRPRRPSGLPGAQGPAAGRAACEQAPDDARRAAGRADRRARHQRRLQVLARRRLVAAGPLQRHRAAGARLRGGDTSAELRDAMLAEGGAARDGGVSDAAMTTGGRPRRRSRPSARLRRRRDARRPSPAIAGAGPRCAGQRTADRWTLPDRPTGPRARSRCWAWAARRSAATWSAASGPTGCACRSWSSAATTCRRGSAPETLVVASSYSGAPRRRSARSAPALERRCPVAVITTGGALRDVAAARDLPLLTFPGGGQPRAVGRLLGDAARRAAGARRHADARRRRGRAARSRPRGRIGRAAAARSVPTERQPGQAARLVAARPAAGHRGERLPGAGRAALEDAAQREQQVDGGRRGAAGGDPQHGRRLSRSPDSIRDHLFVVFLASSAATTRATRCAPRCPPSC